MTDTEIAAAARHYLTEQAPLLFLRLDSRGKVVDANRFTRQRILGERENIDYREIFLFSGQLPDIYELARQPDPVRLMQVATVAGLPETFQVWFQPATDGFLVFGSMDADETMHLRRELLSLNSRLSSLTRELQKKNQQLEELNRLKNQFLGMAAHDLRKPASAVLGYAEFLLEEAASLDSEQKGFVKTIHDAAGLMGRVIDDFLDISMIESGRFEIHPVRADIRQPVDASVNLNRRIARKKGIFLDVVQDGSTSAILMDVSKVEQVINNLISNAIEHSPPDTRVMIRISSTEENLVVAVTDAGPGVTPAEREALFSPFTRGTAGKTPGTKSIGLGLAISKKIVEAHGGDIWAEKVADNGAVFAFRLPLTQEMERKIP